MSSQPNQTTNFTTFADSCLHFDSLTEAAKHTVEMLLRYADTYDCYEADWILSHVTNLDLRSYNITDISPLSALTNLTELYLGNYPDVGYYTQIADISPLSALTNLTTLHLYYTQIADISPLSALTNLTTLCLNNNHITDISPLSALTNLTELYFYNQIVDISSQIVDISSLSALTNLISALTNLTTLHLDNNQIADISPLSALTNLTTLHLNYNQIADISPLSALTNLRSLDLDNNPIVDLSPLQSLEQLNYVQIYGVDLPKKYFYPLHQWQAQWLLEEDNAELRRLLIQTIGYDRICQELQATELDSWREYTLLEIDLFNEIYYLDFSKNYPLWRAECPPHKNYWRDLYAEEEYGYDKIYREENKETIYLLEMICPSTGHIHTLRVPPDMKSAREAIRWVNWGIDPEEFAVQT